MMVTGDEFWRLIDLLDGSVDDEAVERLEDALAGRDAAAIVAFADRLAEALFRLDLRVLADQPFSDLEDPGGGADWGQSADAFLYARCAVVAAGRKVFDSVLREPSEFARPWDLGAEVLLGVAPNAYGQVTGREWDHEEPVSYESGSNPEGWSPG
jgi:hypothetical protein